jgi:hypothetical protein
MRWLARKLTILFCMASAVFGLGALASPLLFCVSRIHLVWIWLPFSEDRFRVMIGAGLLEIRTVFSGVISDYDTWPFVPLVWLSWGSAVFARGFFEIGKPWSRGRA